MIIKTLVDNNSIYDKFKNKHDLSLYIETNGKKLLMDVGFEKLFLENAKKINVDIKDIDYIVISHRLYDHGGGLKLFLQVNDKAEIFIHRNAFNEHFFNKQDQSLKNNPRIIYTSDHFAISNNIRVFSNVQTKYPKPKSNTSEFKNAVKEVNQEDFSYEQNLMIKENDKTYLFCGSAHNRIINIIEKFKELKGAIPDYVIGDFHLYNPTIKNESFKVVDEIAEYLFEKDISCYTGHFTDVNVFNRMKIIMNRQIQYLPTDSHIEI